MRSIPSLILLTIYVSFTSASPLPKQKEAPRRLAHLADVQVEYTDVIEECEPEKICVQGQLFNNGGKAAENVRLLIEIGGTKYIKPRISYQEKVENPLMESGDRQEFHLTIDRKIPYKDKGELKAIEVGKYNFKVVPVWKGGPGDLPPPATKAKKKSPKRK